MAVQPLAGRGMRRCARRLAPGAGEAGLTLIELIVAFSLLLILSTMAVPVARVKVQREKERRLRAALGEMRTAIDRHKDMADQGKLGELDPNDFGYPKSLEQLVEGVGIEMSAGGLPAGAGISGLPASGLETSRPLGGRQNPTGGIGSRSPGESPLGGRGALAGDRSRQGLLGALPEDPPELEEGNPQAVRFLRSIPVDPMTGRKEWGLLSVSDDPQGRSWSGRNVFDVYSLSQGIALDGTRYSEW